MGNLIKVIGKVGEHQGPLVRSPAIDSLLGWLVGSKVEQRDESVVRCAADVLNEDPTARRAVEEISRLDAARPMTEHMIVAIILNGIAQGTPAMKDEFARVCLRLPLGVTKRKAGKELLRLVMQHALKRAQLGEDDAGAALECATAMDLMLSDPPPDRRLLAVNPTALSDRKVPWAEWDVLRIDWDQSRGWWVTAVECSVNPTKKKSDLDREKLETLREVLQGKYDDLVQYRARLASVKDGRVSYEDAGRGFEA